jgi:hypothetical protein
MMKTKICINVVLVVSVLVVIVLISTRRRRRLRRRRLRRLCQPSSIDPQQHLYVYILT